MRPIPGTAIVRMSKEHDPRMQRHAMQGHASYLIRLIEFRFYLELHIASQLQNFGAQAQHLVQQCDFSRQCANLRFQIDVSRMPPDGAAEHCSDATKVGRWYS